MSPVVELPEELPDEARLALLDLDIEAQPVRGRRLAWDAEAGLVCLPLRDGIFVLATRVHAPDSCHFRDCRAGSVKAVFACTFHPADRPMRLSCGHRRP